MATTKKPQGSGRKKSTEIPPETRARYDNFVEAYISTNRNGTRAAISAGYSEKTAASIASELLNVPYVAAAIKARWDEVSRKFKLDAEDAVRRLADMNNLSLKDIFAPNGSTIAPHDLPDWVARMIDGVEMTETSYMVGKKRLTERVYKYRVTRKSAALDMLIKHHGLYAKDNEQRNQDPEATAAAVRARLADMESATRGKK